MKKMRNAFCLTALAAACMMASCTSDQIVELKQQEEKEIGFRTLLDKGEATTRASVTTTDNILSFTVSGIKQSNDDWLFNGFGITRGEDDSWNYTPKRYWPTGDKVDFYAYSPSSSRHLETGLTGYVVGGDITYTVPPVVDAKGQGQEDFLVAKVTDKDDGMVTFNFHHALSRVRFYAKANNAEMTYIIDKIELVNLSETANFNYPDAIEAATLSYPTDGSKLQPWSGHSDPDGKYTADMGESPVYVMTDYKSVLGENDAILVMPQKTKLLNGPAPGAGEFAIAVSYEAFIDETHYAGKPGEPVTKYFAVKDFVNTTEGITFEMGRQYNFYFEFGGEAGSAISFNASVSEWSDEAVPSPPNTGEILDDYSYLFSKTIIAQANGSADGTGVVTYDDIVSRNTLSLLFNNDGANVYFKGTSGSMEDVEDALKGLDQLPNLKTITIGGASSTLSNIKNFFISSSSVTKIILQKNSGGTGIDISGCTNLEEIEISEVYSANVQGTYGQTLRLTSPSPNSSLSININDIPYKVATSPIEIEIGVTPAIP